LRCAVDLSIRYLPDRFLPDKALDLLDEASSRLRIAAEQPSEQLLLWEQRLNQLRKQKEEAILEQDFEMAASLRDKCMETEAQITQLRQAGHLGQSGERVPVLKENDIADVVTQWTGIPTAELMSAEGERLLNLESQLSERVIGQDSAIRALAEAIRRGRTGLKDPKRPIGSFLFLGSSGVGKTELCLALAEALFGTEDALIRLDMSEYMEKHSVSRMIGSPPGYVGFEEGGQLTEKIRRRPYAVVLFDEIEKAHPDVYNILLQILEDGALTDSQGRKVDFKNCVLILTSNVGSSADEKNHMLGFSSRSDTESRRKVQEEARKEQLKKTFRPEFLNRLDAILTFAPLGQEQLLAIAVRRLETCKQRLADMHITLEYEHGVAKKLIESAKNPAFGARPLRREVTNKIENMLATLMLQGSLKAGDHVQVIATEDGYDCRVFSAPREDRILLLPGNEIQEKEP